MANPNPNQENLKPFQPGHEKLPGCGRPKEPPKQIKQYTKNIVAEIANRLFEKSIEELEKIRKDTKSKGLEAAIAGAILKGRAKGDLYDVNLVLERIIGKVPIKQELSGPEGSSLIPPAINFVPLPPPVSELTGSVITKPEADVIPPPLPEQEPSGE